MLSKTPLLSYETTFGSTFILGHSCIRQVFINYEHKTKETNMSRLTMVFNLGEYVGECVNQYKIM